MDDHQIRPFRKGGLYRNPARRKQNAEPYSAFPGVNYFGETIGYDINGNITHLARTSRNTSTGEIMRIDNLSYTYSGNRLNAVTDSSQNYEGYPDTSGIPIPYDDNGNMISHEDKGILQVDYNHLNLPKYLKFNESIPSRGGPRYVNTKYLYRADGIKKQKIHEKKESEFILVTTLTDYLEGFQYEYLQYQAPVLKFIPTTEGYYDFENNHYIYHYKDQVGNIRLSYKADANNNAEVVKESSYYPFGLEHKGDNQTNSAQPAYRYGFQEQEKQEETGWSSFKWRNYDSSMGRFFNIDPLSEKYEFWSPYTFSGNRVVDARELEGLEPNVPYKSYNEAAKNFGDQYNGMSIRMNGEIGTQFYKVNTPTENYYSYTLPKSGGPGS